MYFALLQELIAVLGVLSLFLMRWRVAIAEAVVSQAEIVSLGPVRQSRHAETVSRAEIATKLTF